MTEFRRDPITRRWVVVVPERGTRPSEHAGAAPSASTQSDCPFCEGNESRTPPEVAATGPPDRRPNQPGWHVRVIPNRFPTVSSDVPATRSPDMAAGFERSPGFGYHEVVIESPTHSPLLPFLAPEQVRRVLRMSRDRARELSARPGIGSVTLFENAGPESGGSLWHPHSQLVATPGLSPSLEEELHGAEHFRTGAGVDCAFEEVLRQEVRASERVVFDSAAFVAYAPFAAAYPFEVRFVPRRHAPSFADATDSEVDALAQRLPGVLRALIDTAPGASYNFVVRSPVGPSPESARYHWHLDLYPRLLRPDGFDLGSGYSVNPVAPEEAATALRNALGAKP